MSFRDVRKVYLYAVCFASLFLTVVAGIGLAGAAVELALPPPSPVAPQLPPDLDRASAEEARARVEAELRQQAAWERRRLAQQAARDAVAALMGSLLYAYHWRLVRREEAANGGSRGRGGTTGGSGSAHGPEGGPTPAGPRAGEAGQA